MPNTQDSEPGSLVAPDEPSRPWPAPRVEDLSPHLFRPDVAERFGAGQWEFTPEVADQFDDHVRASVPYYDDIQAMIAEASDWLLPQGGLLADIGCSTGNTTLAVLARHPARQFRIALYDQSVSMLAKARPAVEAVSLGRPMPHVVDAYPRRLPEDHLEHTGADLTVIAFVLQFLDLPARTELLRQAARAAVPGMGALLLAEKTRPADSRWAEIANDASHDVKATRGISDTAIRAKARALRGVLRPLTLDHTLALIAGAGWEAPEVLFRWHSWVLIGAFAATP